jgi:hypothetical protein
MDPHIKYTVQNQLILILYLVIILQFIIHYFPYLF